MIKNKYGLTFLIGLILCMVDFGWYTYTENKFNDRYNSSQATVIGYEQLPTYSSRRNDYGPQLVFFDNNGHKHSVTGYRAKSLMDPANIFSPKQGDKFKIFYNPNNPGNEYVYNKGWTGLYIWHLPLFITVLLVPVVIIFIFLKYLSKKQRNL